MTQHNNLINQVVDCCQEGNREALNNLFDNLNEQILAESLWELQNYTACWLKKYIKDKLSSVTHILKTTAPRKIRDHNSTEKKRTNLEDARIRGKQLHRCIEDFLKGETLKPFPKGLEPWKNSIEQVLNKIQRVLYIEDSVFHLEMRYWGKVDCIVQINGVNCLIDWKTADHPYKEEDIYEYKIQCAAYLEAANRSYELDLRHAWIVVALPNGKAQEFRMELKELNQHFQEWKRRVNKFCKVMLTPGTVITNPDSSAFTVQKLLSLKPILQYKATNFQPSLQQVNSFLDTHAFNEKSKSRLELLSAEDRGLDEGLDIEHKHEYDAKSGELKTIHQPDSDLELLIEAVDLYTIDTEENDEFLETQTDEDDAKSGKVTKSRHRTQTKKKQYTEDSIRVYLQEIGRIRLLRADEEIELARKIAELLQMERVREELSEQLERDPHDSEWAQAVELPLPTFRYRLYIGRRAKEKMVQSNLRLVVSIAKKYMNRGLSFQDLIQEGSLGLIRAAENFDHEKGYKFSTYATWWIHQAIERAIADQSRTIRLPVHLYETISQLKKTTKLLSQEMGRKPTEEKIATRMEMTIEKLRFIAKSAQLPISLETPIYVEKDFYCDEGEIQEYLCLGDLIETDEETPEDQVSKNLLRADLEKVLDSLSPCERDVLRLRYGLDDGRMKTLDEIGQIFNMTRERIRQVEAKALRKLRHPNRNSVLKEYINVNNHYDLQAKKDEEHSKANHSLVKQTENDTERAWKKSLNLDQVNHNNTKTVKNVISNPQYATAYFNQGVERYRLGDFQGAIEDFTRATQLNPSYADAYSRRSSAYAALKEYQKALNDLQIATNFYRKDALVV